MRFKPCFKYNLTIVSYFIVSVGILQQVSSSEFCQSLFDSPAICVNIFECDYFIKLMRETPEAAQLAITASICPGTENLTVCCPQSILNRNKDSENQVRIKRSPLSPPQCGFSNKPHNRIVGGTVAAIGAWPWIANIAYPTRSKNRINIKCGGALISSRHILTAAHCCKDTSRPHLVRLGEFDLSSSNDGAKPINIPINKIIVHPNFNKNTLENDIAILKLNKSVKFTDAIHPICLPITDDLKNNNFVGKHPFVAGWGKTSFNGNGSSVLRETQIPVVNNNQCKMSYRRIKGVVVNDKVLCAGYADGGKDACQGDSGGPLMLPKQTTFYLIGIVSGGYRCAEAGYPGLYTRISSYLNFILKNMN